MLKIGDKLLCKKKLGDINIGDYYSIQYFTDIEFYKICIGIINSNSGNLFSYGIGQWNYIWIYFYTPKQLRKLKLKQVKNA